MAGEQEGRARAERGGNGGARDERERDSCSTWTSSVPIKETLIRRMGASQTTLPGAGETWADLEPGSAHWRREFLFWFQNKIHCCSKSSLSSLLLLYYYYPNLTRKRTVLLSAQCPLQAGDGTVWLLSCLFLESRYRNVDVSVTPLLFSQVKSSSFGSVFLRWVWGRLN